MSRLAHMLAVLAILVVPALAAVPAASARAGPPPAASTWTAAVAGAAHAAEAAEDAPADVPGYHAQEGYACASQCGGEMIVYLHTTNTAWQIWANGSVDCLRFNVVPSWCGLVGSSNGTGTLDLGANFSYGSAHYWWRFDVHANGTCTERGNAPVMAATYCFAPPGSPAAQTASHQLGPRGPPVTLTALTVHSLCNPFPTCANFWGGGFNVRTYDGVGVANDNMQIQSIGGGHVQIFDWVHGGCVGNGGDNPNTEWAQGGLNCPSAGAAAWGTVDTLDYASCASLGGGWFKIRNQHSGRDIAWVSGQNDQPVWLNILPGSASCLHQF